jgi:hypothetical protein
MPYTTESIEPAQLGTVTNQPNQFNLPVKEFVGYDPKGTTTVTGSNRADTPKETGIATDTTTPSEAPIPEVPKEELVTLSPKVSALARKEQAQRQREKELATKERSFADKMSDAEKYRKLTEKIKNKDYSAIDELGVPYEEIVKHELNKEASKNPEQERVRKVEEELAALKKQREEDAVKEYQANQALWKQEIVKAVTNSEEFSTIRELSAEDIVLQHINDSFEEDDVELTVEQACKDIEQALFERAEKFASVPKLKNKAPEAKVLGAPKPSAKTITQNLTTTPKSAPSSKPFHLLSESEQITEAIRRVQAAKLQR